MRKILITIAKIIFLATFAIVGIILLTSKFSIGGLKSYIVKTGSMEPAIHVGSVVFTFPSSTYMQGDIITFNRDQITVTHRLVGETNNQYLTKGDANKVEDTIKVNKRDIIGKDVLIIPYVGKIVNYLKTIPGFILFIGLPILLYIGFEVRNIKKELEIAIEKKVLDKHKLAQEHE